MARGGGGGSNTVYLVGLIFAILVSMVLLGVSYKLNEDLAKQINLEQKAKQKLKAEKNRVKELVAEVQSLKELVVGDPNAQFSKDHYDDTILKDANKTLQEILNEEWIATEDWKNIQDPQIKKIWEDMTQFRGEHDHFRSLVQLSTELMDQLKAVIHIIPRLRYQRIRAREEVDSLRSQMEKMRGEKQREIEDLRARLTQADDEALELARKYDQEKKRLQDEKEKLLDEMARVNRDHALQVARLDSEKNQLQGKIKDLTKKKTKSFTEYSTPDGEVIYADANLGYAWIDLGANHGLQRNTVFHVYQFIKGGRQKIKGLIEVRKIEGDMAQCAILEAQEVVDPITGKKIMVPDPNDPVVKGDLIRNPFFDKDEQKIFVFLGTQTKNRYYNLAEMRRKISEFGGKVSNKVTTETDFVVILNEDEDDFREKFDLASSFGVVFMREEEFLEYLGR